MCDVQWQHFKMLPLYITHILEHSGTFIPETALLAKYFTQKLAHWLTKSLKQNVKVNLECPQ